MEREPKTVVTIARQLGSGGSYLGRRVAQRQGFAYLDREILQEAAASLGVDASELEGAEERVGGFWERVLRAFELGTPDVAYFPPPVRAIPDEVLFEIETKVIRRTAVERDCVIVGHAGFHSLQGEPRLANVFVHAPLDFRVRRVADLYRTTDEEARAMIERADQDRERFILRMTGKSWYDARNYHLSVDTERTGFERAEEMILALTEPLRAGT